MTAGGIIEDPPVAGHQSGIRDARRRNDYSVDWVAMKRFR